LVRFIRVDRSVQTDAWARPTRPDDGTASGAVVAVVARTYARALFGAARDAGRIDEVQTELEAFVAALDEVPELRELLRNPELDPPAKAEALEALLEDADELVRNFLRLVAEKGRATLIDEIAREYYALVAAEEQILNVELTTAYELSDEEAASIVRQIEESAGRRVEASRSVDPELVGGLVLKAGSLEVDSSVRGRLDRLRRELKQGATL
jgi:F-type H+-transporting ATPase subunit delta